MSVSTYTLVSYNTSYVNDCNDNQLHGKLSESASIVAKAIEMGKMNDGTFGDDKNLGKFRMSLADTATKYIKSKMDSGADFIALIEQSIHVNADNHANYDAFSKQWHDTQPEQVSKDGNMVNNPAKPFTNNQDLGSENTNYGIMKRINALNLTDISLKDATIGDNNIVYDQIVNYTLPFGPGGEGVGIVFKKDLIDTLLHWNKDNFPVVNKLRQNIKGVEKTYPEVNYYSDDLGQVVCFDKNGNQIYYNAGGKAADLGRPIIMTAGFKGTDTLNILVAAHGPNIFNMKFDTVDENNKPIQKQIKEVVNNPNFEGKVNTLFDTVCESISRFINDGLDKAINKDRLSSVKNVNVFFGGDMNDPRGQLLESMSKGLQLNINDTPIQIKFNYELGQRRKAENENVSQYGYETIISCCANTDSVKAGNGSKSRKPELDAVGPMVPNRIDGYPEDFYKPENFGYNGDYALFGSTLKSSSTLSLDLSEEQKYTENNISVFASDHLPVISNATVSLPANTAVASSLENTNMPTKQILNGGKRSTMKKRPKRTRRRNKRHNKRTAKK